MTNDETDITMALPWSMVSSSSDRRHGHMDDGDDDDDNDHKNDSYTAAGAAPGASIINIYYTKYIDLKDTFFNIII